MALSNEQRIALANEARAQALAVKIAGLKGQQDATSLISRMLSSQSSDAAQRIQLAQTELDALKLNAGPGVTDEYGERSVVDNAATAERTAGQIAVAMAIKQSAGAVTQDEALMMWETAALATRPAERQWLLNNPTNVLREYLANLVDRGAIPEATWEAMVAWVVATPIEELA